MAQNVICKDHDLERSRIKNGTIRFHDVKNIDLDAKNCHKCLSSKVMDKDVFLHNGEKRNKFMYVAHSNRSRYFLIY